MTEIERQEVIDNEHLKIMSIVHFVYSIPSFFVSMYLLLYAVMMPFIAMTDSTIDESENVIFICMAVGFGLASLFSILTSIGLIVSGISIRKRKFRILSLIVSLPLFLSFPIGTLVGVLSIILFNRPSIKKLYSDTHINKQTTLTEIGL